MNTASHQNFPFQTALSLRLLVEYWEERIRAGHVPIFSRALQAYIDQVPALRQPVADLSVLEKHQAFINFLITAAIPMATSPTDLVAVIEPFKLKPLYSVAVTIVKNQHV